MFHEIARLFSGGTLSSIGAVLYILYLLYALICGIRLWLWDLRQHRLPIRIVFPLIAATHTLLPLVAALNGAWGTVLRIWGSGLALWLFYALMRVLSRGALGRGDVRLALALGGMVGYFSWENVLWATLMTFIAGGLCAVVLVLGRKATRNTRIAFGPFMLIGALAAMLAPSSSLMMV